MNTQVYVGLGGNIGDPVRVLDMALDEMLQTGHFTDFKCSNFYRTSPVGPIAQDDYVNAVCAFKTGLAVRELQSLLQAIEKKLGKLPKPKNCPRPIDLDLLFYGTEIYAEESLHVPHPYWDDRLFVLVPLLDLTEELWVPAFGTGKGVRKVKLRELLRTFQNRHQETVIFLTQPANEKVRI